MKKFLTLTMMFLFVVSTALAAVSVPKSSQTAVVIVGGSDYKTKTFTSYIKNYFKYPDMVYGSEVQTVYQSYWLNQKGLLEEGKLEKEDLIDFVNYSGYKNVIYLMVSDPVVDVHDRKGKQKTRVSITMNAYLVDKTQILKNATATHEEDSDHSELRAKSGAFKQCVREVSTTINP